LNVHGVNDVRQTEIHAVEPLVLEPSAFVKLKIHKSLCIDRIPAELIKARSRTVGSEIHKLISFLWNKE